MGQEIIRYGSVSQTAPWTLLDVERGAFGTQAQTHGTGEPIGKLADHGYRVFLADAELGREMAENLAHLFNETGLRQISFDGLEGNRSTGMGNYGEILFTMAWFDALSPDIRNHFIAEFKAVEFKGGFIPFEHLGINQIPLHLLFNLIHLGSKVCLLFI